jgi:uncharacterized membrane protein
MFMQTFLPPADENTIEATVMVQRPVTEVFTFYREFTNLPRFLGDVMAVQQIGPALYRWTIQGPLRIRVNWTIKVTDDRPNELIRYETATSPRLRPIGKSISLVDLRLVKRKFAK